MRGIRHHRVGDGVRPFLSGLADDRDGLRARFFLATLRLSRVFGRSQGRIGQEFYAGLAEQQRLKILPALDDGLLPNFTALQGEDFAPDQVCPEVCDFYEQTVGYRLEVWNEAPILTRFSCGL